MKLAKTLLAAAVAGATLAGASVQAAPVFGTGLNHMFYNNYENVYRSDAACALAPSACLANGTVIPVTPTKNYTIEGAPTGYQLVNPFVTGNIHVGDLFVGIFNVQNIDVGGVTLWETGAKDRFSGYFLQQVAAVDFNPDSSNPGNSDDHLDLTAATVADPFGILNTAAGEQMGFFVNDGPEPDTGFQSNGTILDDITRATDGALWATLGDGLVNPTTDTNGDGKCETCDQDGFAYSHPDLTGAASNVSQQRAYLALNLVNTGAAYNLGAISRINDTGENEKGGVDAPQSTGMCFGVTTTCTDFVANSEINFNDDSWVLGGGNSPWIFASNDPMDVYVPEPGMLALFGAGLIGLAGANMRRRRNAV